VCDTEAWVAKAFHHVRATTHCLHLWPVEYIFIVSNFRPRSYSTSEVVSNSESRIWRRFPLLSLLAPWSRPFTFIWNACRNQRRVEIEIRPVIPEGIRGKLGLMEEWSNSLILVISPDFKHTNAWDCEICGMGDNLLLLSPQILNFVLTGKPSRETSVQVVSWIHLPQPKIVVH